MATGHKGDFAYSSTLDPLVEFFSKAGNFSPKTASYYGETIQVLDLFRAAWPHDDYKAMQLHVS